MSPLVVEAGTRRLRPVEPLGVAAEWEAAVAMRDYDAMTAWAQEFTGFASLGINVGDLTPGEITSEFDGQVIEGVTDNNIRVAHNNVTIRGCQVRAVTVQAVEHASFDPKFNATVTGLTIEHTTWTSDLPWDTEGQEAQAGIFLPDREAAADTTVTIRQCNVSGMTTGFRMGSGSRAEYNWCHDFGHPPGGHCNPIRIAGKNVTIRRNFLTDGTSGVCSMYFDDTNWPVSDAVMEENVLAGISPEATPSYLIQCVSGVNSDAARNVKIRNNYLGNASTYQFGLLSGGGGLPWGTLGHERSGNEDFLTGALSAMNTQ